MLGIQFNSLSFMGMSDCNLFPSEKDQNSMEFNSSSKPTSEFQDHKCQVAPSEDSELREHKQEKQEERDETILVSSLMIKTPSLGEFKVDDDDNDGGFRTPTSLDQRIPLITQCPPAPRKPKKTLPLTKRKVTSRRIMLDLSSEIESLFPQSLLADLSCGKIKKARKVVNGIK